MQQPYKVLIIIQGGITMGKCKNDAYRTEPNGSKTSKVEMFKWKILDKPAGEFMWMLKIKLPLVE